jgi:CheY-like chemotaxis protein
MYYWSFKMTGSQKRVLIVDDDTDFLRAVQLWFVKENFVVTLASNGDDAVRIIHESAPMDLILTDFMMPERNGMELVRMLKKDAKLFMIPIVVMSNNTNPEFRARAHEMGASAYLLKPEGARAMAEKAAALILHWEPEISAAQTSTTSVEAMRSSLLSLIRITSQSAGLPIQAKNALISAEKLAETLFAVAPEHETSVSGVA